ncbi:MAG TPA: DinB family protein [Acidimicrobiales bacterium]|nr:DinB family protein [Acidimicrobiales bacterium]
MVETAPGEAAGLADDLEAANDEAIAFADGCSDAQWSTMVRGEEWPVGVVLHHIATGHEQMLRWLGLARRGEEILTTAADIDADNARHARDNAGVSRPETVEALRRNGAALARVIRSLDADELARSVPFGPADAMAVTTQALAAVSARHCRTHLAVARGSLEPAPG